MKTNRFPLGVLSVILLFSSAALAQTSTGTISGVVHDESGAVVPGVNVTVTNVDQGIGNSLATDASGRFHVPTLIPGHYEIQAQAAGFQTGVRKGIQLTVGSDLEIDMVLKVGQVSEKTEVTAEAPIVETATSTLSGLVDDKTIRELPLNGRSFDQLISLDSSAPTFRSRSKTGPGGMSDVYSVSGARTQANLFLIDGTEMLGGGSITTAPGGALGKNMGVDAVQEFVVLTSNYSSAYGKKGGAIINIATRSGTNQLHGTGFEFLRNSALDARNFFDVDTAHPQVRSSPPPFRRNNFGGALGGPIRKDHSFLFGNYEGMRQDLGLTSLAIVPDASARDRAVAAVKPYLAALYPLPNGRSFGDGTGEFTSNPQQPAVQDFFLVRFDQKLTDKDSFFSRYNFSRARQTIPDSLGKFSQDDKTRDQAVTLEERRAYSTTVNVARFGYTRATIFENGYPIVPLSSALVFVPGADTVGQVTYSGVATPGGGGTITRGGPSSSVNKFYYVNQFDTSDQVYHYKGPHSLQFGVQIQRIQHNDHAGSNATRGTFQFADLAALLAGRPLQFQGSPPGVGDNTKAFRQTYFSTFIQDDYKVRRNLTLNLGLRYEILTVPVEASGNRISNFRYKFVDGFRVLDTLPNLGSPFYNGNHKTFAPRIGFAWDPKGDGKLAVRGGFGIFYDQIDSEFRFFTASNPPFDSSLNVTNPPFPLGFSGALGQAPLTAPDGMDFDLRVPTRLQYSFGIQRQITSGSAFNIGYVGSHSYHLTRQSEANSARPQILAGNVRFYPAGASRLNPALANSRFITSDADGFYNSLQMNFTQRVTHGVRYKVSYTWARSMDEASNTVTNQASGNPNATEDPFNRKGERGLSAFDVRQNMVANFTYDLPWSSPSGLSGRLLGGWQLGGIVTVMGGTPFSVLAGSNRSRDLSRSSADRPVGKAGASNNPVLGGPDKYFDPNAFEFPAAGFYGNVGRNTVIGAGFEEVDLTVAKVTTLNERFKLDFRADLFNIMNRANFGLPSNAIFNSSGQTLGAAGRIQNTLSTSRQIQFGLKLQF